MTEAVSGSGSDCEVLCDYRLTDQERFILGSLAILEMYICSLTLSQVFCGLPVSLYRQITDFSKGRFFRGSAGLFPDKLQVVWNEYKGISCRWIFVGGRHLNMPRIFQGETDRENT